MRKLLNLILSATLLLPLAGCNSSSGKGSAGIYTPGSYTASATGFGGDVTVTVTVDANSVTDVEIVGADATPTVGGVALEELTKQIKEAGSSKIDGVSGASLTSNSVKEATESALEEAKGSSTTNAEVNLKDGTYNATATSYAEKYGYRRNHESGSCCKRQ